MLCKCNVQQLAVPELMSVELQLLGLLCDAPHVRIVNSDFSAVKLQLKFSVIALVE